MDVDTRKEVWRIPMQYVWPLHLMICESVGNGRWAAIICTVSSELTSSCREFPRMISFYKSSRSINVCLRSISRTGIERLSLSSSPRSQFHRFESMEIETTPGHVVVHIAQLITPDIALTTSHRIVVAPLLRRKPVLPY